METRRHDSDALIARTYTDYRDKVMLYIRSRINDACEAENLTQDVWVQLLTYRKELNPDSIVSLIYTIARNIVNDYLRHLYFVTSGREEYVAEVPDQTVVSPEYEYVAQQLADYEKKRVECLPPMRRIIYVMSRFDDMAVADISERLQLSVRTVENHLRLGRHDVRRYMAALA